MQYDRDTLRGEITQVVREILDNAGRPAPEVLRDEDHLTDQLRLDSLDFAVMVVELERRLGGDPFRAGGPPVRTLGDFIDRYQHHFTANHAS